MARCFAQPHKLMGLGRKEPQLTNDELPDRSAVLLSHELHAVQRPNECGPCVASAIVSHITGRRILPATLAEQRVIRGFRGTVPYDWELQMRQCGAQVTAYNASGLSSREQERFLHQELAEQRIVALVTEMHKRLHFIALLGYDHDFLAYNPLCVNNEEPGMTRNLDTSQAGNCRIDKQKVIDDWRKAQFHKLLPLYRGYAASVATR